MKETLRRFFYYWRFPIYCLVLGFIFMMLGIAFEGNVGIALGVLWLITCTAFVYFFVSALIKQIKGIIYYIQYGEKFDDIEFPEIEFFVNMFDWVIEDIDYFKDLPGSYKVKCILFRLLGTILIVVGSVCCLCAMPSTILLVIFTLVIIGGATLWVISNPKKYNEQVSGVRMVIGKKGLTDEILFSYLNTMPTSLGTPVFADVIGFKKKVMVYGSKNDEYIYVVYKAKYSRTFYISSLYSFIVESDLPERDDFEDINQEFGYYLDELCEIVEEASKRAFVC